MLSRLALVSKFAALGGVATVSYYYLKDSRAAIYPYVLMPLLHRIDAEQSHNLSIKLASLGIIPKDTCDDAQEIEVEVWGRKLPNPIGLAAGYDKNAEAIDSMMDLGFGLVEVGSVTPRGQVGNPLPRFFRLKDDSAVINRYGFNSQGHDLVRQRLEHRKGKKRDKMLGINLGKNKLSPAESHQDYLDGITSLGEFADYIVINISSPNTPGLRALQRREPIEQLLSQAKAARDTVLPSRPPLLVKIGPDCSDSELEDIAAVLMKVQIDGIIISNTTITRPASLKSGIIHPLTSDSSLSSQTGGLSGAPLKKLSLATVSKVFKLTKGTVPIVGCGGIATGQDALDFAKAGASVVQIYTSLGYRGPGIVREIKDELAGLLRKEKLTWMDCIGRNHLKVQ